MATRRIPDPKIGGSIPSGLIFSSSKNKTEVGSVSEGLRRQIRNLLGSARASSNLVAVVFFTFIKYIINEGKTQGMKRVK